ncbi:HAMP domain-containing histidine kinase [Brevibacillus ruminantium]|uniref:histidine kinase n=1 Tax=Brevibacillus ruminantium TaxID=2950604 RepID=A0ABY4WAY6_9BACL|nr:HAMP domain-containing sensor histidine kinase [Brevibacillus ruminantium]USG63308.1 HAMP domain-containing histidine kinase [Brevibacillus ruminantium]
MWRRGFRRNTLKWRLTLLFTSAMLLLLLFLSVFVFWSTSRLVTQHEQRLLDQKTSAIVSDLQTISYETVVDPSYLNGLLINFTDVNQSILLLDLSGNKLASSVGADWNVDANDFGETILQSKQTIMLPFSASPLILQVMEKTVPLASFFQILSTILFFSSLFTILLSGAGGYMLSTWGLKPLDELIAQIHSISPSRLSQRLRHQYVENEIHELIEAFNQLLDRVEEAMVMQKNFVSDASHELRTPLMIIDGYASLLQRWGKEKTEIREEALGALRQECERLFRLVDDLLALAKHQDVSRTKAVFSLQPLSPLLEEVRLAWMPIYSRKLSLFFDWEEDLWLVMDRERIRQLFDILLDNAYKYTEQGQVKVTVDSDEEWIHICVEDTGVGIPPKDIPFVFQRFYRVEKSRNRKKGGSGLGLAIAQDIVDEHNGMIRVEPSPGKGVRVHVSLKKVDDSKEPGTETKTLSPCEVTPKS